MCERKAERIERADSLTVAVLNETAAPGTDPARLRSMSPAGRTTQYAKWAKALLASAMRWMFSRLVIAPPSRL